MGQKGIKLSKCKVCKKKATVETLDGNFCRDHLPDTFCAGCGQLIAGNEWHELSVQEFGVCGDCLGHKLENIASVAQQDEPQSEIAPSVFDDDLGILDDLEPLYNPATMEILEPPAEGQVTPNLGTAIRRIQKQLGFEDENEEF